MPTMRSEPWAKFTTFITPKMRVRPKAVSPYMDPIMTPLSADCRTAVMRRLRPVFLPGPGSGPGGVECKGYLLAGKTGV